MEDLLKQALKRTVSPFDYIEQLDCFVVTEKFKQLMTELYLNEWTPVVWLCRLLSMDEDYGEHVFDNWEEREALEARAKTLGYSYEELMVIVPQRMVGGRDGPCHSDEQRGRFWRDVLTSMRLSYETLFEEAREKAQKDKEFRGEHPDFGDPDEPVDMVAAVEQGIAKISEVIIAEQGRADHGVYG